MSRMKSIWVLPAAALLMLGGCVAHSDPLKPVATSVQDRTGHRVVWNRNSAADAEAAKAVQDLLSRELSAESAVQVALLNNRSLQATFEDLGIAQAELVQAGLLKNPIFEAKIRYAEAGGGTGMELNAVADFLDIFLLPLRKKVAAANLQSAQHRVTAEVLSTAAEVRKAFYEAQAARQTLAAWRTVLQATDASATLARRMHAAGNISDLDLAHEQVMHEQAKLDAARREIAAVEAHENLVVSMGLWGSDPGKVCLPERLMDPPANDPPAAGLESLAVSRRSDLLAARSTVEATAALAGVSRPLLLLEGSEIGATAERGHEGGWEVGPIIAVPIPLFDTGAATHSKRHAEYRQAAQRYAALAVQIRSQVRVAWAKTSAARQRVAFYRDTLLSLRERIVQQTQLQYNAMHTGLTPLLLAKQEQIKAGMEYVEAIKEYWIARAELERAVGGRLPGLTAPAHK
jgi:cobalt-zinc-cadmium efflux system outer membrane protein